MDYLSKELADVAIEVTKNLPYLRIGEALICGYAVNFPVTVLIRNTKDG
ncbi:MAG: hypothetical protein ABGF52_07005 [Candidatus Asgardarchaeum sp.]